MDTEKIKELVTILERSSLNYMEIAQGEFHLKLGKGEPSLALKGTDAKAWTVSQPSQKEEAPPLSSEMIEPSDSETEGIPVKSPMVGVFYAASSPSARPFVQTGQTVKKGEVLCIIEAMKLMNEITAERDGVIAQICVEDGDIVEFGQPLFYIK